MLYNDLEILISRYGHDDLSAAEVVCVEEALRTNPEARKALEQYRRLDQELAQLPEVGEGVDYDSFAQRVRQAIEASTPSVSSRRLGLRRILIPLAAAAVLFFAMRPWFLTTNNPSPATTGAGPAVTENLSVRVSGPHLSGNNIPPVARIILTAQPTTSRRQMVAVNVSQPSPVPTEDTLLQGTTQESDIYSEVLCYAAPRKPVSRLQRSSDWNDWFIFF